MCLLPPCGGDLQTGSCKFWQAAGHALCVFSCVRLAWLRLFALAVVARLSELCGHLDNFCLGSSSYPERCENLGHAAHFTGGPVALQPYRDSDPQSGSSLGTGAWDLDKHLTWEPELRVPFRDPAVPGLIPKFGDRLFTGGLGIRFSLPLWVRARRASSDGSGSVSRRAPGSRDRRGRNASWARHKNIREDVASGRDLCHGIRKAPFLTPQESGNIGPDGALSCYHLLHGRGGRDVSSGVSVAAATNASRSILPERKVP